MSETENKLEALEAKVKKLVDSHKLLMDENTKLKEEIDVLNNEKTQNKGTGRPLKSSVGSLNLTGADFSDKRKVRKAIDEMIIEIDKSIKKFES